MVSGLDFRSALPEKKWVAIGVQHSQSPGLIAQQKTLMVARVFLEAKN
jgi:hypothetical protein